MKGFEGKTAFVTGASSGIGRACGLRLKEEGARVFGVARRVDRLQKDFSDHAAMDVCDPASVEKAVDAGVKALGKVDFIINAAGVIGQGGLADTDPDEWKRIMDPNLDGVYRVTRALLPHLNDGGAIVNISSVCSVRPLANLLAYCTSKAAIDMFTKCLALELASRKIRVNAVNPGVVVTELHTVTNAVPDYEGFLERSKTTHPLGRTGRVEEVAALAAFLCSSESEWITGNTHLIDGGRQLLSAR